MGWLLKRFSGVTKPVDGIGIYWAVFGPGGVLSVIIGWASAYFEPIARLGWGAVVLTGALAGCVACLVISTVLVSWRYFRPLSAMPRERPDEAGEVVFLTPREEAAYLDLLNFIIDYVLPAIRAQIGLQESIIEMLTPNKTLREFSRYGLSGSWKVREFFEGYELITDALGSSPPKDIPFKELKESVGKIERQYQQFCDQSAVLAKSGSIDIKTNANLQKKWNEWREAHNRLKSAYEPIKRDKRFEVLFRPLRESRWGELVGVAES